MKAFAIFFSLNLLVLEISTFDAIEDVRYMLFTRKNIAVHQSLIWGNIDSIKKSSLDPKKPTRFIIHGFMEGLDAISGIGTNLIRVLLNSNDFNVIFVDWSVGAKTIDYGAARNNIKKIAPAVAQYIDLMHSNNILNTNKLKIIGFSLGANAAGLVGKHVKSGKLQTIISLDSAGPLFDLNVPAERIARGDAQYVECIHTNGGVLGLGIGIPFCDADFFPNGGSYQIGCACNNFSCSHLRAVSLYIESIQNNKLWANRCENPRQISRINCQGKPGAFMGGEPSNTSLRGTFYLETNLEAPFGQGKW